MDKRSNQSIYQTLFSYSLDFDIGFQLGGTIKVKWMIQICELSFHCILENKK